MKYKIKLSILLICTIFISWDPLNTKASDKESSLSSVPLLSSLFEQYRYVPYIEQAIKGLGNACEKIKFRLIEVKPTDPKIILDIENSQEQKVGKIHFHIQNQEAKLDDITLNQNYQGQGLGKAALLCFYKLMDKLGIAKTTCVLQSAIPYTAKLYLSIGMRFEHEALETLARSYNTLDEFLVNSSGSNTGLSVGMFRVGNTPFQDSTSDQKETFLRIKNTMNQK